MAELIRIPSYWHAYHHDPETRMPDFSTLSIRPPQGCSLDPKDLPPWNVHNFENGEHHLCFEFDTLVEATHFKLTHSEYLEIKKFKLP